MKRVFIGVAVVAALGAIVGTVMASAAQKVNVCHKGQTLSVDQNAVPAHTGHGDTVGACPVSPVH